MAVTLANLVSYYSQESLGFDSHGPNDLVNFNAPTQAAGIQALAVDLVRASSQYQAITDAAQVGLDITGNITIAKWVYLKSLPSGVGANYAINAKWGGAGARSWFLIISAASDRAQFFLSSDGTTSSNIQSVLFGAIPVNVWTFMAARWDGAALHLRINTTDQTPVAFAGPAIFNGAANFQLGAFAGANSPPDVRVDEISIWNEFASDDQLDDLYHGGAGLNYAATRALFDVTVTPDESEAVAETSGPIAVKTPVVCGAISISTPYSADYQLYFVDPVTGLPIDIVPVGKRIHSLKYVLKLNDIGDIRFTMDATDRLVQRIINREDILCDVLRRNSPDEDFEVEKTFFIRYWDIFEEENRRESIIFAGVSLEDLLRRRIVVPDDDILSAAGFSTKSGFADIVMRDYVRDQLTNPLINANRTFPELYLAAFAQNTIHMTFQRRKQEDSVLDVLQDIANTSDVDFQIYRNGGNRLEFLPQKIGEDRSATRNEMALRPFVLFSTRRGNIKEPRLTYDRRKDTTVVYVAGQGIEEDRVYVPVGSTAVVRSPYNRVEGLIDSRDDDSIDQILNSGSAEIHKTLGRQQFDFEVAFGRAQTRYNVDWSLGDIITAEYREVFYDYRLTEMSIEVKESGEQLTPTFEQDL